MRQHNLELQVIFNIPRRKGYKTHNCCVVGWRLIGRAMCVAALAVCTIPGVIPTVRRERVSSIARGVKDWATTRFFADRISRYREAMADAMKTTLVNVHAMIFAQRARSAGHDFVRPLPALRPDNCEHCHFQKLQTSQKPRSILDGISYQLRLTGLLI